MEYSFSKNLRLHTSNQFDLIFKDSKKINTSEISVLGRFNLLNYPRIGLIVAKKHIRKAHERNRIKRLVRESFRLNKNLLLMMDFIVIVRKLENNNFIYKKLQKLWYIYYQN